MLIRIVLDLSVRVSVPEDDEIVDVILSARDERTRARVWMCVYG